MTQLELAEKMGVTDKAVSKWERDLSCPDISSIPKLAEIFGISVDELMQVKAPAPTEKKDHKKLVNLALRGIALAMGIAAAVLSILGELDTASGFGMLGIGLSCLALSSMQSREE